MSKPRRSSRVFTLQSDDSFGHLSDRRSVEDMEYAVSNQPFDAVLSNTRHIGSVISSKRIKWASIFLIVIFILLIGRSLNLQVMKGTHYRDLAESNRFRVSRILSQRGLVTDRHGIVLAKNIPSFVLSMTIADLPSQENERRDLFNRVSTIAGIHPTELDLLLTEYAKNPTEPIPVKVHLSYERAMHLAIETKQLPGFGLQTSTLRSYPSTALSLSHILGYMGSISVKELETLKGQGYRAIDSIGKLGVEKSAESLLRGVPGEIVVEVDSRGRELSVISKTDPVPGQDIQLTIDAEFQAFIETKLKDLFARTNTSRASVVAINPKNGEIYALVSLPAYNSNDFAKGIDFETYNRLLEDEDKPLFSRAVSGEFPSGSTFKPFVAYAALAEHVITEHTSFLSIGGLRVGEWFFPDWKSGGHGVTDVRKALAESVNTFFYTIGGGFDQFTGLGVARITDYADKFGFGKKTGIDLPGEADGFLPSKEWKEEVKGERWYVGDTYHLAIGQGDFLTTPLQIAKSIAMIANNGEGFVPHVIQTNTQPTPERLDNLDAYALSVVKQGMRQTILTGSARSLQSVPVSVAGKTGTAQAPGKERYYSWFTGFAPYEDPEIAVAILVEEGGESTDAAVPIAREILTWWFQSRTE